MKRSALWLGAFAVLVAVACGTSGEDGSGSSSSSTSSTSSSSSGGGLVDPVGDAAADSPVEAGPQCTKGADCPSKICSPAGACLAPTCSDGAQNADETDIDCGGSCGSCDLAKGCEVAGDCTSGVCKDAGKGLRCQAPACDDGVKNGDETDQDCGGATCAKCAVGKACNVRPDCATDVCTSGVCVEPTCDDALMSGKETDVDCGGPDCPRCADTKKCKAADDCASGVCKDVGQGLACQPPACDDDVTNGKETDLDCGGPTCKKCGTAKACKVHADCASDGCAYDGTCAPRKSCTARYGGDTCGPGGAGGQGPAAWESCCATAPAGAGGVAMDKYKVTAGRMRVFMERTKGNVRATVRALRAAGKIPTIPGDAAHSLMPPEWDLYLPTTMEGCEQDGSCDQHPNGGGGKDIELSDHFFQESAADDFKGIYTSGYRHLGGSMWSSQNQSKQGCRVDAPGAHTYWMDAATQAKYFGDIPAEFAQSEYDTKPINCTTYLMLQAFCLWDGGRLGTVDEWTAAIGPATYPWGASPTAKAVGTNSYFGHRFPDATNASEGLPASQSIEHGNFSYSYEYPHLGPKEQDFVVFMNAPGRLSKGVGPWGHADLAYSMFENTSDVTWKASPKTAIAKWVNSGSWEGHDYAKGSARNVDNVLDKYGKMSGRCVYP